MPILPNPPQGQDVRRERSTFRVGDTGARAIEGGANAIGRGLQAVGESLAEGAIEVQEIRDERAAIDALAQSRLQMSEHLHDPVNGALRKQGSAAEGLTQVSMEEAIEPMLQRFREDLSPNAQRIFDFRIAPEVQSTYRVLADHEATQTQAALDEAYSLNISSLQSHIGIDYRNHDALASDLVRLEAAVEDRWGDRVPEETVELAKGVAVGQALQERATNALIADQFEVAEDILRTYRDQMAPAAADAIERMLADRRWSQIEYGASLQAARVSGASSIAEAQEVAVKLAEREAKAMGLELTTERATSLRKAVVAQVDALDKDVKRTKEIQADSALSSMNSILQAAAIGAEDENGNPIASPEKVFRVYANARNMLEGMNDAASLKTLDAQFNNWRDNPTGGGYATVTDPDEQERLDGMTDTELAAVSQQTFAAWKAHFTKAAWDEIVERRTSARDRKPGGIDGVMNHDKMRDFVIERMHDANLISQGLQVSWKNRDAAQRREVSATLAAVKELVGEDRSRNSVSRALSEVMLEKRFTSPGRLWGEYRYSLSELYDSPKRMQQHWPEAWALIERQPGFKDYGEQEWWLQRQIETLAPTLSSMFAVRTAED